MLGGGKTGICRSLNPHPSGCFSPPVALTSRKLTFGFGLLSLRADRLLLSVTATAPAINKAIHLQLAMRKRPDGSIFYAADREPSTLRTVRGLHRNSTEGK
jgi:hypothetical protein